MPSPLESACPPDRVSPPNKESPPGRLPRAEIRGADPGGARAPPSQGWTSLPCLHRKRQTSHPPEDVEQPPSCSPGLCATRPAKPSKAPREGSVPVPAPRSPLTARSADRSAPRRPARSDSLPRGKGKTWRRGREAEEEDFWNKNRESARGMGVGRGARRAARVAQTLGCAAQAYEPAPGCLFLEGGRPAVGTT